MSNSQPDVLANSARGATFLILLQVGSRALTFAVNQVLLRFLSPELLGISSQLELYGISVLYFARESLRVSLQRQRVDAQDDQHGPPSDQRRVESQRTQEVVNLSYIAVLLGPLLACTFAVLYMRQAGPVMLMSIPWLYESLVLFAFATTVELLAEPCFVVAQQRMRYGLRASAESAATLTRCVLTCAVVVWASVGGWELGVLPFAVGQLGYALVLNVVYYGRIWRDSTSEGYVLIPRRMSIDSADYVLSLFYRPTLTLSINLYAQSGLKHLLTQGDSVLIALFASLSSQGVYALASNYGSLVARMLFQPIEESSRGVFGRLLASDASPVTKSAKGVPVTTISSSLPDHGRSRQDSPAADADSKSSNNGILSTRSYLTTLLHLYGLLSLIITVIGPTIAPLLLRYVAGPAWTSAGPVLSAYCYYIPLLALNGILEAFVTAVATPAQLRVQSVWMLGFSAGFAGSGYVLLRVYDRGAKGLVAANAVNMATRIVWSWTFVGEYLDGRGLRLGFAECLPDVKSISVGILVASYLAVLGRSFRGEYLDLAKTVAVGGMYGLTLLYLERGFLYDCYLMVRPPPETLDKVSAEKAEKQS
ncbi:Oligosaccharide translocation protein rft1 [Xylographa opegraphella]|nr:Oligosaccharide translocation protein rft1 [Xylographa opegraphella]